MQILPKAVPESMFRLTDFAVRTPAGFRKPPVYCESGFRKALLLKATGEFQLADIERAFTFITGLLKLCKSFVYRVSVRIDNISSAFIETVLNVHLNI
jgi:hypothetical protein